MQISLESDSLRKLIVSEINMFKNIEYDLLNVSRQMESLRPAEQIEQFSKKHGSIFTSPIVSIYAEGPVTEGQSEIDLQFPISATFFEETLLAIETGCEGWMLDNKHNSTLRFCLQQAWRKFEGMESEDFMEELEECILKNRVVENVPLSGSADLLSPDEVFSTAFSVICTLGSFLQNIPLSGQKQFETVQLLRKRLASHHLYRFIATLTLEEFSNLRDSQLGNPTEAERFLLILRLLI